MAEVMNANDPTEPRHRDSAERVNEEPAVLLSGGTGPTLAEFARRALASRLTSPIHRAAPRGFVGILAGLSGGGTTDSARGREPNPWSVRLTGVAATVRFGARDAAAGNAGVRGAALVWAAVLIYAAGSSAVRLLAELGAHYPVAGRNPITPCNVLLVGTFCAFVVLAAVYRRSWTRETLRALSPGDWLSMTLGAVLSGALAPAFTLLALDHTSVTNLVLVGRLEPVLFLVLSTCVLGERLDRWALAGLVVTLSAVGLIFALEAGGAAPALGEGELYAALAAASLAGSTIVSRVGLQRVPLGVFTVFRTGVASVLFCCTAVYLYGPQHFTGALSPFLWTSMAVYGALFVVAAQLCWFGGIRHARTADISLAGSFSPVAGVLFALILLAEPPSAALATGGAVIVLGIAVGQFGARVLPSLRQRRRLSTAPAAAAGLAA